MNNIVASVLSSDSMRTFDAKNIEIVYIFPLTKTVLLIFHLMWYQKLSSLESVIIVTVDRRLVSCNRPLVYVMTTDL